MSDDFSIDRAIIVPRERFTKHKIGENPGRPNLNPRYARALYTLIAHFREDTEILGQTRKLVLTGLLAEYLQPDSLDDLAYPSEEKSYRGHHGVSERMSERLIDYQQADMLAAVELNSVVFDLLAELANRHYQWFEVVMFRFGFWDGVCWTFAEIGEQLGVSRARCQQLERIALEELRNIIYAREVEFEIRAHGPRTRVTPPVYAPITGRGPHAVVDIKPLTDLQLHEWLPPMVLAETLGMSRQTLYKWRRDPTFPAGLLLDEESRATKKPRYAYSVAEVLQWAARHRNIRRTSAPPSHTTTKPKEVS